jgi:transglutaminase-like putative cysteine protease
VYLDEAGAPQPVLPARTMTIAGGIPGIRQTLKIMRGLALEGSRSPMVRQLVQQLTAELLQKDWLAEIAAIHRFVRDRIRYVRDIEDVETVQSAEATLKLKSGDCDDKAVLMAAMLKSIGHPSRFVAVGFKPGKLTHVYVEARVRRNGAGSHWVPLENTEPWDTGVGAPGVVGRMIQDV